MSITDELREAAAELEVRHTHNDHDFTDFFYPHPSRREFLAIADRIDAEHEAACAEAYGNGTMSVPIALDESQWVKLPVDADGVPIRVGDVMEWIDLEGKVSVTCTVEAVGVNAFIAWDKANGRYAQKCATAYRHHHEPTVEDVLTEFAKRVCNSGHQWGLDADDTIAEFASRLCLAKEGE